MLTAALTLLALVNAQRAVYHVPPLKPKPGLAACSEGSPQIIRCAKRAGMRRVFMVGIIEAWGYETPGGDVAGWLNSPPHRQMMLDPVFRFAGVNVGWGLEPGSTFVTFQARVTLAR